MTSPCVQGGCPPVADDFVVVCVSATFEKKKKGA